MPDAAALLPGRTCPNGIVVPPSPLPLPPLLDTFVDEFADALLPTGMGAFGITVATGTTTGTEACVVGDVVVTTELEVVSDFFFCASVVVLDAGLALDGDPLAAPVPAAAVASARAVAVWTEVAIWMGAEVWTGAAAGTGAAAWPEVWPVVCVGAPDVPEGAAAALEDAAVLVEGMELEVFALAVLELAVLELAVLEFAVLEFVILPGFA